MSVTAVEYKSAKYLIVGYKIETQHYQTISTQEMNLKIGFFWGYLLGIANGCANVAPNEQSCQFVETCIAESANTDSARYATRSFAARYATKKDCKYDDSLELYTCKWELKIFATDENPVDISDKGVLTFKYSGLYRIDVTLYNGAKDCWIKNTLHKLPPGENIAVSER